MLVSALRRATTKILAPVVGGLTSVAGLPATRRVWAQEDRLHVEVSGIHRPGTEDAAEELRQRLVDLPGVRRVEINGHLGRMLVVGDREVTNRRAVLATIAEAERQAPLAEHGRAPASTTHPGNAGPGVREVVAFGLNLAGAGYTAATSVLPVPGLRSMWPTITALVDSTPLLRGVVEAALGRPATDAVFAFTGVAGQIAARRPFGLLTDAGYRFLLRGEAAGRQQAWQRWERATATRAGAHEAGPMDYRDRPVPVPDGPVEKVATASAALAVAGYAGVRVAARNAERAGAVLTAGVPRAAKVGREGFASRVARDFSRSGSLVLEPDALRRLDRVDVAVLDPALLLTGRYTIDAVEAVGDQRDDAELSRHAHDLVDRRHPRRRREHDEWAVTPIEAASSGELGRRAGEPSAEGALTLVMSYAAVPVALVRVLPELDPMAEALVEAARESGTVLLAGADTGLARRLRVDQPPLEADTVEQVAHLQAEGRVVAVVTRDRAALALADVGIGLRGRSGWVPWGADVVCPDARQACLLLSAVPTARRTSRDAARLSLAGSVTGALLGGFGPPAGATARASFPVHLTAVLSLGVGTWRALTLATRPAPVPVDRTPWHAMSRRAVLSSLSTTREGLPDPEAARRHGRTPDEAAITDPGLARASLDELATPLTPALAAGAGISASIGSVGDAVLIAGVLALNALIGGAERVGAGRELRQLLTASTSRVRVRRGGHAREATSEELAPGDVIELQAGDVVPADCRLLEAPGLEVDESSLTGESQLVTKSVRATTAGAIADRFCMIYQGTVVAAGRAVAVVVATGARTEAGRSAQANGDRPETGVETRLSALSGRTLPIAVGAGIALLVVNLLRGRGIAGSLAPAVSLAVAAVPEGLPFVATVAELASARRLAHRGVLVRAASTIEALGRVDVLCFDKTGTLTEGHIALRRVSDGTHDEKMEDLGATLRAVLAAAMRASPWHEDGAAVPHPTDRAVLEGGRAAGVTPQGRMGALTWVADIAFEPARGYHATLARGPDGLLLSVKGAPEVLLPRCTSWQGQLLDDDARRRVDAEIERLTRGGYRVLAVGERAASDRTELDDDRIQNLDLRGFVALADPVRATAAAAVSQLRDAGVNVVMVTGDHPSTAAAIGAELDMINGRRVLTGAELDRLTDEELPGVLADVAVFARVSPAQKARLVRQLREAGRVVAMTGDGANDAPAIRLAHVGIALGHRATPAAREAADLVVVDDRIETITAALVEGRAMWSSVRDAVGILLGGNLGEILFTVVSGVASATDALNARQLLLVNLLTDVLPAMAVAVRPPVGTTTEELLAEGPEASLGGILLRDVYRRAAITAGAAAAGWLLARPVSTHAQASTTALVALIGGQLAQTVTMRGRTPLVAAATAGSLAALAVVVQIPGLSQFFGCRPLLPHQWGIAAGAAAAAGAAELLHR
ncbi:cation-translocating P-type ATPase [Amycolatopsis sp. K13G38]|uniref:Cation-translocating P-type ATPase n=1 Tax=Amycolatopsis acididurans TaxID=2724524 RepID=A0ABX1JJB0_9PSEU|nr:cation-translocating P-type ATPase [Amycolatopsis acididurans]NKQ58540.1 cation-translocating P-type ATPase [Amycolatopsis acididurans]